MPEAPGSSGRDGGSLEELVRLWDGRGGLEVLNGLLTALVVAVDGGCGTVEGLLLQSTRVCSPLEAVHAALRDGGSLFLNSSYMFMSLSCVTLYICVVCVLNRTKNHHEMTKNSAPIAPPA